MNNVYPSRRGRYLVALLTWCLPGALAVAQTIWSGATSTDWFDAANWSNGLPSPGNDAIVPGGARVAIDRELEADFDIASFGAITATAEIHARGALSTSGTFVTTARVNAYDAFENFGEFEVTATGSLLIAAGAIARSNGAIFNEGWLGIDGALVNEGEVDVTAEGGFDVYGSGTFDNPGATYVAGYYHNRDGATSTNPSGGMIVVEPGGRLSNDANALLGNAGVIRIEAGGLFEQTATFVNVPGQTFVAGTLRALDGATTTSNFLTVERGGRLLVDRGDAFEVAFSLVNDGTVDIRGPITVSGTIDNRAGATLTTAGSGVLDFTSGTDLTNAGSVVNAGVIRTVGLLANTGTFTNDGTLEQRNGGTIDNDGSFVNNALIANIDRIVNDGAFDNRGTLTNGSGGIIENNKLFTNATDATLENLFEVYNKADFVNFGFVKNGVTIFNDATFDNFGFLSNVGDVSNREGATFNNEESGVVDNSGAGIFTNDGTFVNDGEFNNFDCGILANNGSFVNNRWLQNDGIIVQDGELTGKPVMGEGPVADQGGTSATICEPFTQKLDADGRTVVGAARFAAARFDSCDALRYLIDGEEELAFGCDDVGTHELTFTLVDRRGNRINCAATLTIVDGEAPRLTNECPGDILVEGVTAAPAPATWTPPAFADNCTDVAVTSNFEPGDSFPEGPTVVTYTATDDFGNAITCAFTVTVAVTDEPVCAPVDARGLVAYYNLTSGRGKRVLDRSGYGEPLHLEIENAHELRWLEGCGLVNTGESIVKSLRPASKIGRAAMMTDALTVEAWVRADEIQTGPERIVTYSENTRERNFTLAQEGDRFVFRLKTTRTDDNGTPDRRSEAGAVRVGELQHVVFTRDAEGAERMYVDGALQYSGHVGGDLGNWGAHCRLMLFNENTRDRSFRGAIRNVAIYDRAISQADVRASFARGACCDGDDSPLGQVCEGERGRVTYERYDGIGGVDLPWLYKAATFPASPDATRKLTELDIPRRAGDHYGSRTRGFLYPAESGTYRFAVSGDDHTRLLVSRIDGQPAAAQVVASVAGWTQPGELHKYDSQKSGAIHLAAGGAYYFELLHKEAKRGDHASVYWEVPGAKGFHLVGAEFLGDVEECGAQPAPTTCDNHVLFVVGDPNQLRHGDAAVYRRLVALGFDVTVERAEAATRELAAEQGLVLISSTVRSTDLGARLRELPVPIMTYEAWLYDDLGMTGVRGHRDYGEQHARYLVVSGEADPLARGGNGRRHVLRRRSAIPFGRVVGSEARVIAHAPRDPLMATFFVYDDGARMAGGIAAPAKRIGFFLHDETAAEWTAYGRDLFDAAVRYATSCGEVDLRRRETEVLTLRAAHDVNAVRLVWTSNTAYKDVAFLVERSGGDASYEVIGEVPAGGAGGIDLETFGYADEAPLAGDNFYRVTAIHRDGGVRTSELRRVTFAALGQVGLYPNPAYDRVTISLAGFRGRELEAIVTDALGQVVIAQTVDGDQPAAELPLDRLAPGTYGVTLRTGDYRVTKVLTVTRD